ncbi:MAG: TrbG/VirB9 family P-type conjugative transfer protein [Novosphingobium sp.]
MRTALLALALVLPSTGAWADAVPVGGKADSRVRFVEYNPNQVYTIYGRFRHALEIEFSPGETITQAALGDTISWEIAPIGNIIFLKPRESGRSTNLIVLTNYRGQTRSYRFQLVMNGGPPMYSIKFRYSGEEASRSRDAALYAQIQAGRDAEAGVVKAALDQAVVEGKRNLDYWFRGDSQLEPSEVSDNGEFTVMRFPGHQEIPAIFGVNQDGAEAIIDYDVREDYVVIHGIYKEMRLRKGKSVLCVTNGAPPAKGRLDRTGTVSPIIERTVKPGLRAPDGSAITPQTGQGQRLPASPPQPQSAPEEQ